MMKQTPIHISFGYWTRPHLPEISSFSASPLNTGPSESSWNKRSHVRLPFYTEELLQDNYKPLRWQNKGQSTVEAKQMCEKSLLSSPKIRNATSSREITQHQFILKKFNLSIFLKIYITRFKTFHTCACQSYIQIHTNAIILKYIRIQKYKSKIEILLCQLSCLMV